ncbi:MAG: leucyl aminopeptidase [Gammaproteobacteria bacterium]|nr:leucyl aminopeptidase [Gammaproteobacteria bacterium]
MQFIASSDDLTQLPPTSADARSALIVAIHSDGQLTAAAALLNQASNGAVVRLIAANPRCTKAGELLYTPEMQLADTSQRVILAGAGSQNKTLTEGDFHKIVKAAAAMVKSQSLTHLTSALSQLQVENRDSAWLIGCETAAYSAAHYRFDQLKSKKAAEEAPASLQQVTLLNDAAASPEIHRAVALANALHQGTTLTRDLANLPGNHCTPSYLATQAEALAKRYKSLKTTILDAEAMEKLGMGALLSVARGSSQPAKLIVIAYHGKSGKKKQLKNPIALVGKGLTFDAGGISIKPAAAMDEMKYDMAGGAAVFGTLCSIAEMNLPIDVIGIIPSSENLPDGNANKPGDIVTSMSGQTIEILNTDAEGRLILCDALTYCRSFKPSLVIDIATLTGACVVALGSHASGLLGNDSALIEALRAAGDLSGDRVWPLPLWDEYDEQLKSPFADMANIGGKEAGTITAACFLARFTRDLRWAHLDIAGTAWVGGGEKKGATARPVPLLTQFLVNQSQLGD